MKIRIDSEKGEALWLTRELARLGFVVETYKYQLLICPKDTYKETFTEYIITVQSLEDLNKIIKHFNNDIRYGIDSDGIGTLTILND